jgi:hypothetical protein
MLPLRFLPAAGCLAWGLLCGATTGFAQDAETAGVVRISKPAATVRGQSDGVQTANCTSDGACATAPMAACPTGTCPTGGCPSGVCDGYGYGYGHGKRGGCRYYYRNDWRTTDWSDSPFHQRTQAHSLAMENAWCQQTGKAPGMYYHDSSGQDMINYFRCKFGFLIPTGNGGAGTPPFGKYARVYPQDPSYFDQRDGQVWAAQGYGTPIAVPLAPVVGHQWNYSWGTPSSRLTPISRLAPN